MDRIDTIVRALLPNAILLVAFAVSGARAADVTEYKGICEASAGAFIDNTHFAVASDETNALRIYERGKPDPVRSVDMEAFTSFDKSDLEGAAVIGDRVYWISSHSFNSHGEDKPKRKIFFATKIEQANGKPTLVGVGHPVRSLRDPLAKAAGVKPEEMNIEALAATPEGGLLIGLRAPLRNGEALVVRFKNPAAVVDDAAVMPEFDPAVAVKKMDGRGFRSMEQLGSGAAQYVIVAGPVSDSADEFAVFRWSGPGTDPVKVEGLNLTGLKPEAAMAVPGQNVVQLLSDDGDICIGSDDEPDPQNKRKFRSVDVKP
jgi:Protein of unknown function (DUF3616)